MVSFWWSGELVPEFPTLVPWSPTLLLELIPKSVFQFI